MPATPASSSRSAARSTAPRWPLRRAALGLAAALLLLPQLPACAHEPWARAAQAEMSIVDRDSGQVLPVYRKDGRAYVAGRPGARYAIRLNNPGPGRVLVVLSVDGINVISGQTAAWDQTGYVLDPWRNHEITGWRKSDTAVAAFEFAALPDSYAARTGRPGNVGVIGMAVFREKPAAPVVAPVAAAPPSPAAEPAERDRAKAAAPASAMPENAARGALQSRAADSAEKLGTAHGQRERSVITRTEFERMSSSPQAVVEISYDSFSNLVAAGVIASPAPQARAFPLSDDTRGYVPDPPRR